MTHYIQLGNGRKVGVAAYVAGIKLAKANPDRTFTHGLASWWPETGREILAAYRRHIDVVINRRAGIPDGPSSYSSEARNAAHLKLCERAERGLLVRRCKWCGTEFTPRTVHQHFDDPTCARGYN